MLRHDSCSQDVAWYWSTAIANVLTRQTRSWSRISLARPDVFMNVISCASDVALRDSEEIMKKDEYTNCLHFDVFSSTTHAFACRGWRKWCRRWSQKSLLTLSFKTSVVVESEGMWIDIDADIEDVNLTLFFAFFASKIGQDSSCRLSDISSSFAHVVGPPEQALMCSLMIDLISNQMRSAKPESSVSTLWANAMSNLTCSEDSPPRMTCSTFTPKCVMWFVCFVQAFLSDS